MQVWGEGADGAVAGRQTLYFNLKQPSTLNPLQVDGEPWVQGPSELTVTLRTGAKGLVLRRLPTNSPAARMTALVNEVSMRPGEAGNRLSGSGACLYCEMGS